MSLSVRQRAARLAALRFVEVRLMETLALWVPTTPEMEAKLLFGQHIWDHARHADDLGKRAHELRAPLHHTLEPEAECMEVLEALAALKETSDRIRVCYDVALPALASAYRAYLEATDALMDAPSVRIVTSILSDMERMAGERRRLAEELPGLFGPGAAVSAAGLLAPDSFLPRGGDAAAEAS